MNQQKLKKGNNDILFKEYVFDTHPTPKKQELNLGITKLQEAFPQINTSLLVFRLYEKCQNLRFSQIQLKKSINVTKKSKRTMDYQLFLKQLVAKSLYYLDYGYGRFLQFATIQPFQIRIEMKQYVYLCESVALYTFRYLERFLIKNRLKIKLTNLKDVKQLFPSILNPRQKLSINQALLIKKMMSKAYDLQESNCSYQEALNLHSILISLLAKPEKQTAFLKQQIQDFQNKIQIDLQSNPKRKTQIYADQITRKKPEKSQDLHIDDFEDLPLDLLLIQRQ